MKKHFFFNQVSVIVFGLAGVITVKFEGETSFSSMFWEPKLESEFWRTILDEKTIFLDHVRG